MSKKYPCPAGVEDDCGYPACAHALQCERKKDVCIDDVKECLLVAMGALGMYADPSSYHAMAFRYDPPAGDFAYDFSPVDHPHYDDRLMPGKAAREAIEKVREIMSRKR